jgi:lipopolysaccharide assembly outer membrane protein LptD (OstA)
LLAHPRPLRARRRRARELAIPGLLLLVNLLGLAGAASARQRFQSGPVEITADTIEYERPRALYVADGHVHVVQEEGRTLDADWAAFSTRTRRGVASGHVVVVDAKQELRAEFLEFDLDTLQGLMLFGQLDTGPGGQRIWAGELRKTGEDHYSGRDATFTTCRCPDEDARQPWQLDAGSADVEIGGYGTAWNTTFDILGIPVLWVPWMFFPVKTERETGFLFPEFGFSRQTGYELGLPFFWAVADPVNLKLTPRYLSRRGVKPDLELDYVFGRRSEGKLYATAIQDEDVITQADVEGTTKPHDPYGTLRWAAKYRSDTFLPFDTRLTTDITAVSDNDYPDEFLDLREYRRDRFLESRVFAGHHFGRDGSVGATAAVVYADDLQAPDNLDRDELLLQRAPAVSLDWLHTRLGDTPLAASVDLGYVNFWALDSATGKYGRDLLVRDGRFLDTGIDGLPDGQENPRSTAADPNGDNTGPEGDGLFEEGEPLAARGHRLLVNPRLGAPLRLFDALELYPEVGVQEALYWTDAQDFSERGVLTGRMDLSTQLHRSYAREKAPALVHVAEPRLGWVAAYHRSQRGAPLFVPRTAFPQRRLRQLSRENITLDGADRVEDTNRVFLGIDNRFYLRSESLERFLLELSLSGDVDFEDGEATRLLLDGRSSQLFGTNARFHLSWNPATERIEEGLVDLGWRLPALGFLSGSLGGRYRFLHRIPAFFEDYQRDDPSRFDQFDASFDRVNQVQPRVRIELGRQWAVGYVSDFDIDGKELLTNRGYVEYTSRCRCWAVQVQADDDRRQGLQFTVRFALIGLGDDSRRAFDQGLGLAALGW